uniref:Uncharacterized protein n=1 Tax=Arundo donax TaxID=35708 RepID=A0A0A9BFZ2_ARUDO
MQCPPELHSPPLKCDGDEL